MKEANDPMGRAIMEYLNTRKADTLRVLSSMFDEDEMPVEHLFRSLTEMSRLERLALQLSQGHILDVGAGAGCHSLALQASSQKVTAIDISPLSCRAMQMRGVKDVRCVDFFDATAISNKYDTILMLMNGTGIAGRLDRLPTLLQRLKDLLSDGGQVLIDSSDLCYIYEDEDGNLDLSDIKGYYGEVDYKMIYKDTIGETFNWLYVDFNTLESYAKSCGLNCKMIQEGDHYDYLARLTL